MFVWRWSGTVFTPCMVFSGRAQYGGGRYLNVRQDGKNSITIDFNLAFNPYCAYNPDFACPLPPRENILEIALPVGEKNYDK